MRIAYIGPGYGTSLHRAQALKRLGHDVCIVDPWAWLPKARWVGPWLHHAGGVGVGLGIDGRLKGAVVAANPDLIWVDQGPFLGRKLIAALRQLGAPIVNYTIDDPFGGRDGRRFAAYFRAVPEYDLLVVMREQNISEACAGGARKALRVWMTADELAHAPRELTPEQKTKYASEVAFVGTWMPERGPFLAEIIRQGVPLSIWGNRWQKAPEWETLAPCWRGPSLDTDDDYAAAILGAKINLGLLSKGNRDLHTTRSMEIPALGGLFCAERTHEHLELYEEGKEAVFWADAGEGARQCLTLLGDEIRRQAIAAAGHERAQRNGYYNEKVLLQILDAALSPKSPNHTRAVGTGI